MCDIEGVYRRLSSAKKCRQTIKHENFLRHWLLQTPGEENSKRRKKMNFPWRYVKTTTIKSLYIKGNSFNILFMYVFTYR